MPIPCPRTLYTMPLSPNLVYKSRFLPAMPLYRPLELNWVLSGRSCLLLKSLTPHLLGVLGEGVITERLPLFLSLYLQSPFYIFQRFPRFSSFLHWVGYSLIRAYNISIGWIGWRNWIKSHLSVWTRGKANPLYIKRLSSSVIFSMRLGLSRAIFFFFQFKVLTMKGVTHQGWTLLLWSD